MTSNVPVQVEVAPEGHGAITAEVFVDDESDLRGPTGGTLNLAEIKQVIGGLEDLVRASQAAEAGA